MSNIDKHTLADGESVKTYYIHPMAFGGTKNPGYGHVAVVKAEDFEKLRTKLRAAEKRIAELSESHSKLREGMAAIYNAICENGASTSLSAILTFVKRAREESTIAAGDGIK